MLIVADVACGMVMHAVGQLTSRLEVADWTRVCSEVVQWS